MSATNRGKARNPADFYITPGWATDRFLETRHRSWPRRIIDCGAGEGDIIARCVRYFGPGVEYHAVELREECREAIRRRAGASVQIHIGDYLAGAGPDEADMVIGNPPFSLALEFVQESRRRASLAALFLRIAFLSSERRAAFMRENTPSLYVLPNRPPMGLNQDGIVGTDSADYAWFTWSSRVPAAEVCVLKTTPEATRSAWVEALARRLIGKEAA